jgi:hypothetical protein
MNYFGSSNAAQTSMAHGFLVALVTCAGWVAVTTARVRLGPIAATLCKMTIHERNTTAHAPPPAPAAVCN